MLEIFMPTNKQKKLSLVVPVYYNQESLPLLFNTLKKIEQQLATRHMEMELIFVDDGSGDHSFAELQKIKQQRPETKIIKHARNFGAFQAIKTGFNFVTGDCFLMLSADLQDPPELILEMVDHWLAGSKYVICARQGRKDPPLSKMCSAIYYALLRFFVSKDYPAGGYDFALMDKVFLPYINNCAKNINITIFAHWLGFKPAIIYYQRQKREHGKSRWTFSKKIKLFLDSLLGFSIVPIRMISIIGIIVSLISIIYGCFVLINGLFGNIKVSGFASMAALTSFLLGLIIIMLGIIGEYIWRIFDETSKRPESVIDEIY
jgi:glycosyltransferase involved in cell wall biosynthesis